jgi:GxxExxY protein
MEVNEDLCTGFIEPVYYEAMIIEFTSRDIPFGSQSELPFFYEGGRQKKHCIAG